MVFNVYAPNRAKKQMKLWKDLIGLIVEGEWCITGDFNMVEAKKDRLGTSSLQSGSKKKRWRDVYPCV